MKTYEERVFIDDISFNIKKVNEILEEKFLKYIDGIEEFLDAVSNYAFTKLENVIIPYYMKNKAEHFLNYLN